MKLALSLIRTDGGTQPRSEINPSVVEDYAAQMQDGAVFPPITVYYDGNTYWLSDGFHRVGAATYAQFTEIESEIVQGTLEDAQWNSFAVNKDHGLRRTNEDKQRSVRAALQHPKSQGLSDREIARHVGVSHEMVCLHRKSICQKLTDAPISERTVTRGRSTYEMKTSNIGAQRALPSEATGCGDSGAVAVLESDPETIRHSEAKAIEVAAAKLPPLPKLDRKKVWSCQVSKHFKTELIRLIKAYEKANPPIEAIAIIHSNGMPVGIEILSGSTEQ